jgi:hypothetical protein
MARLEGDSWSWDKVLPFYVPSFPVPFPKNTLIPEWEDRFGRERGLGTGMKWYRELQEWVTDLAKVAKKIEELAIEMLRICSKAWW